VTVVTVAMADSGRRVEVGVATSKPHLVS